jgi:HEAT repeat protein
LEDVTLGQLLKLFLLFTTSICSLNADVEKEVRACLTIGDPQSGLQKIQNALKNDPTNSSLIKLEVSCFAQKGDIASALIAFKKLPEPIDHKLIEEISWAILSQGTKASAAATRQEALISAFVTSDAKSIPLCMKGLSDPNLEVRYLSLQLAAHAKDSIIKRRIFDLFLTSQHPSDRVGAIQALRSCESAEVKKALIDVVASETAPLYEKVAAIDSLSQIVQNLDYAHIAELVSSERAFLRALACELMVERQELVRGEEKQFIPLITRCLFDSSFDVRYAALQCAGMYGEIDIDSKEFKSLLLASDPRTTLLANWVVLVHGDSKTVTSALKKMLLSTDQDLALLTAACINQAGDKGTELAIWGIENAHDVLVRLNLGIGLVWQRKELGLARQAILSALDKKMDRLSWAHEGIFSYVGKAKTAHVPGILSLPETIDMLTRLELYSMLAAASVIDLNEYVLDLLQERSWGVAGQTAALLLQEGVDLFDTVKELLDNKNPEIALQAAFLLATYTQDEQALKTFETAYPQVLRPLKEQILVGIGQIGSLKSLPFLIGVLDSPFESMRIKAARSILLCLYH